MIWCQFGNSSLKLINCAWLDDAGVLLSRLCMIISLTSRDGVVGLGTNVMLYLKLWESLCLTWWGMFELCLKSRDIIRPRVYICQEFASYLIHVCSSLSLPLLLCLICKILCKLLRHGLLSKIEANSSILLITCDDPLRNKIKIYFSTNFPFLA